MSQRRGNWYLLTGLIIGLALGVLAGWMLVPVDYIDTAPDSLRADFKREYLVQIALAYAATGDSARAASRLALLGDPNVNETITALAQRALADGRPEIEVRALGLLASASQTFPLLTPTGAAPAGASTAAPLETGPTLTPTFASPTPEPTAAPTETLPPTATPTPQPTATFTPLPPTATPEVTGTPPTAAPTATATETATPAPSPTPTATPARPFILETRNDLCRAELAAPLLIVRTRDAEDNPIPGVEIIVNWPGNEEHFFTGLKPELGRDYADFAMTPYLNYTLRLADGSQRLADLTPAQCTSPEGIQTWASIELIFVQP